MEPREFTAWVRLGIFDKQGGTGRWVLDGLCSQTDPDAFFPEDGYSSRPAKRICENCPVQEECLLWALATRERDGVWGGKSVRERREMLAPNPIGAMTMADLPPVISGNRAVGGVASVADAQRAATVLELHASGVAPALIAKQVSGLSHGNSVQNILRREEERRQQMEAQVAA